MVYTTDKRIKIVRSYVKNNDCVLAAACTFNEVHSDKSTDHQNVVRLMQKFMETASVANKKTPTRKIIHKPFKIAILEQVAMGKNQSLNQLYQTSGVSSSSV